MRLCRHYGIVDPERTVNEPFFSGLRTHNARINWMSTTRLDPRFTLLPYVVFYNIAETIYETNQPVCIGGSPWFFA
jgi:hypothetical protein